MHICIELALAIAQKITQARFWCFFWMRHAVLGVKLKRHTLANAPRGFALSANPDRRSRFQIGRAAVPWGSHEDCRRPISRLSRTDRNCAYDHGPTALLAGTVLLAAEIRKLPYTGPIGIAKPWIVCVGNGVSLPRVTLGCQGTQVLPVTSSSCRGDASMLLLVSIHEGYVVHHVALRLIHGLLGLISSKIREVRP